MVMIKDPQGVERFSLPQQVYNLLMRVQEKILHEDQEIWICFGGDTGTGKSLMSMRWMYVVWPGLTIKQVCFDKKEFIDAVLSAEKGTGIILDESISILFNRASMTAESRLISELIAQIRQKNLAIFLNIPSAMTLDRLAQEKLNCYVHVWESRHQSNGKLVTYKGNAALYPEIPGQAHYRTQILSYMRKKNINPLKAGYRPEPWITVKGDPIGVRHRKPWYPVPEDEYRAKKESILEKYRCFGLKGLRKQGKVNAKAILSLHKSGMTQQEIAENQGISARSVWSAINDGKLATNSQKDEPE